MTLQHVNKTHNKTLHITGKTAHIYFQIATDGKWIRHVLLGKQSSDINRNILSCNQRN